MLFSFQLGAVELHHLQFLHIVLYHTPTVKLRSFILLDQNSYILIVFVAEDIVIFLSHSPWQSFWHVMVVARCQIGSKRILLGNFFAEIGHTRAMKFLFSLMEKMSCTFQTLYCTVLLLNMNSFIMTNQCLWLNIDLFNSSPP